LQRITATHHSELVSHRGSTLWGVQQQLLVYRKTVREFGEMLGLIKIKTNS
jgi:hypothetical protein